MTQHLIGMIGGALLDNERAHLEIARREDGQVRVTVLPDRTRHAKAKASGEEKDEEVAKLRAALALPLQVVAPESEIDAALAMELGQYNRMRSEVNTTLEALQDALAAGKSAEQKAKSQPKAKAEGKKKPATDKAASSDKQAATAADGGKPSEGFGRDNPTSL